jgi:secondary thiamine-phosphate synthase enzyme
VHQHTREFVVETRGPGLVPITGEIVAWVASTGVRTGLLTLHILHTSASLLIQENADPEVLADFERFFRRLVPEGDPIFRHTAEGPDRAALTARTLSLPVRAGAPALGTWQGIYLYEHRAADHRRRVLGHLLGE